MNKHTTMLLFLLLVFLLSPASGGIDFVWENHNDIEVEIKGEVVNPAVYTLEYKATVEDIIELAGLTDQADLSTINLTKQLKNHDVIVIPTISKTMLISINSATIDQLVTLPGIGPTLAERIVEFRNRYGSFQSLEDIQKVKGIGEKLFEKIKDYICL